ncbi:MAG: folylpolyglutamate synthase/dihydrofolate synthase family protein [Bacteroidota bacterium]
MNYQEAIDFMYACLPFFQKTGKKAYNPGFENILKLCKEIGNPQNRFKSIHIAGTNGKGSSAHILAAILQSSGYKTGLYTSPHLKSFTERIKVNGKEVTKSFIATWISKYQTLIENIKPSFFEVTVAMAFDYFVRSKVDIVIVETGLGGRLDATNIIQPEVSLITNIGFDHMHILGNTLPKIATEKAGIIKQNTPVVISEFDEETATVFRNKAKEEQTPIVFASKTIEIHIHKAEFEILKDGQLMYEKLSLSLPGAHQLKNVKGVLQVIEILNAKKTFIISQKAIRKGLANVQQLTGLKGRWQVLQQQPLIVCDVGHNEAGLEVISNQLKQITYRKLHLVFGMLKEKEATKMLKLLPQNANFYFCKPDNNRGLEIKYLVEAAQLLQLNYQAFHTVNDAFNTAKETAKPEDMIFIGGSTFVVAEII